MNDLEFRQQVLDTKSASFCAAKWYNATIWLGSGMTTSCHHPPAHRIDAEAIQTNPSAIHNTVEKKMDRLAMQTGNRPKGCEVAVTFSYDENQRVRALVVDKQSGRSREVAVSYKGAGVLSDEELKRRGSYLKAMRIE